MAKGQRLKPEQIVTLLLRGLARDYHALQHRLPRI
jgi:hypothetical protein